MVARERGRLWRFKQVRLQKTVVQVLQLCVVLGPGRGGALDKALTKDAGEFRVCLLFVVCVVFVVFLALFIDRVTDQLQPLSRGPGCLGRVATAPSGAGGGGRRRVAAVADDDVEDERW